MIKLFKTEELEMGKIESNKSVTCTNIDEMLYNVLPYQSKHLVQSQLLNGQLKVSLGVLLKEVNEVE